MQTKHTTGDKVYIPGEILSAREENGVITYEVSTEWMIPEADIMENTQPLATGLKETVAELLKM